jgi:transposase InsO family protein
MSLWGVFSYFQTSRPTELEMTEAEEVYMLTPSRWDPHQSSYATNEENMLDWEGNMIEKKERQQLLLSDIEENPAMAASVTIGSTEAGNIDLVMDSYDDEYDRPQPCYEYVPRSADQVSGILAEMSPILIDELLYERMEARARLGKFQTSIGSTNATDNKYIVNDDTIESENSSDESSIEGNLLLDEMYEASLRGDIDLDDIMVSATHAGRSKGISAEQLAKTWRIDLKTAKRTIDITSQKNIRKENPTLSRNYGTNDRMLRYKRINDYFFMDTFFATKKAGKSSRGNTCCQLFVTDKGFVYVVPMKTKGEVLQALKQFAKEIGAPDAIVSDAAAEQSSQKLRKFCSDIGTTLRLLEEGTPWANKAELYIGLIKEAVRKDMKESNCPLAFWDYCVERRARINNLTAKSLFKLHGTNAHTALTGEEGDISNLSDHKW